MRNSPRSVAGLFASILACSSIAGPAMAAEDTYFARTYQALTLEEINTGPDANAALREGAPKIRSMQAPYVVLDGPGEAFANAYDDGGSVFFRVSDRADVSGRLFTTRRDGLGMRAYRFKVKVAPPSTDADSKSLFADAKQNHYQRLVELNHPGASWFRHQRLEAISLTRSRENGPPPANRAIAGTTNLDGTFAFFSGNLAVNENLQLDRTFELAGARLTNKPNDPTVAVDSIPGIKVAEMDWSKALEGRQPRLDPLAGQIPADQHAAFFPSLQAAFGLLAHFQGTAAPLARSFEAVSSDRKLASRYEHQLGVSLAELGSFGQNHRIQSIAVTGSDPYFAEGTDLAILFEADAPPELRDFLKSKLEATRKADPEAADVGNDDRAGARSPDRSTSSYVAMIGRTVVLTNSPEQLKRLNDAASGRIPNLGDAPEYRFFRDRYKRNEENESAFLILTDATIRRWCGPRWRIAQSRRVRAMADLGEAQAANLPTMLGGTKSGEPKPGLLPTSIDLGPIRLGRSGVRSEQYGTIDFLTPIAEIPLTQVGQDEANAYGRWRETYQQNWRGFFDPIALRLSARPDKVAADLSVIPLILNSQYQWVVDAIGNVRLKAGDGDPHPGALAHCVMALNTRSELFKWVDPIVDNFLESPGSNMLGWFGRSVAVYADDDPFWARLMAAPNPKEMLEKNPQGIPIGVRFDVTDHAKLKTFFLRAEDVFKKYNYASWDFREYRGRRYSRIVETQAEQKIPIYCHGSPRSLVISLSEDLIKRAIDRDLAPPPVEAAPMTDQGVTFRIDRRGFGLLGNVSRAERLDALRAKSWGNLPILNEWKRRFPDRDPVALHEAFWGETLLDPCGGQYVWNERWATLESTIFGHPGEPKTSPENFDPAARFRATSFGLNFEDKGMRARTVIELSPQP